MRTDIQPDASETAKRVPADTLLSLRNVDTHLVKGRRVSMPRSERALLKRGNGSEGGRWLSDMGLLQAVECAGTAAHWLWASLGF